MPTSPDTPRERLIATLTRRIASELSDGFDTNRPTTFGYAPGRLDVMGGVTDYTGSPTVAHPIDRGTAVAIQSRADRVVSVFSFNLFDEHKPFTLLAPLNALTSPIVQLRAEFAEPGRSWAGYVLGCLAALHSEGLIDLRSIAGGFNIAVLGDIPPSAGLGSSSSLIASTLKPLVTILGLPGAKMPELSLWVENQIIGMPTGPMDHEIACSPSSSPGNRGREPDFGFVGVTTGLATTYGAKEYARFRCAASIAHNLILDKMRQLGLAANRELIRDPMDGRLSNLALNDYRKFFRSYLPETIKGSQFLLQFSATSDRATKIELGTLYPVLEAADFHVFQANRIRNFQQFLNEASMPNIDAIDRKKLLDKAGHLMYAAHQSYAAEAGIIDPIGDRIVELVRKSEPAGLYGAKLSGRGGAVGILGDTTPRADAAIDDIMRAIEVETGKTPIRISLCR